MYKVHIVVLEGLKKQLAANNKVLATQTSTPSIAKTIKDNEKQIKLLKDEYYID